MFYRPKERGQKKIVTYAKSCLLKDKVIQHIMIEDCNNAMAGSGNKDILSFTVHFWREANSTQGKVEVLHNYSSTHSVHTVLPTYLPTYIQTYCT